MRRRQIRPRLSMGLAWIRFCESSSLQAFVIATASRSCGFLASITWIYATSGRSKVRSFRSPPRSPTQLTLPVGADLRFLSCVQSQLCTKTATTAYSQSSSPRLPFFRTLLLAELEFDDAAQLSFPNHTFPSLEVLDCQRAADFKRIFDCHPVPFPKLKAIYPPRNLPPDWLAPFDLPRSSSQWTSGPAESSGHPSGRPDSRVDPLVCLCLDDETLEEFPTIGASIPSEVFILMLNFRPDEVDDAHLEAFINSPHLEKLLPARTVPGAGRGHKTRGISSIIPEASDFYSSLEELYPDLADQLNAVLEDRIVLWLDSWVTQEWDDYGGVQSLYFLSTAEVLVKAWEFKWCTMYR